SAGSLEKRDRTSATQNTERPREARDKGSACRSYVFLFFLSCLRCLRCFVWPCRVFRLRLRECCGYNCRGEGKGSHVHSRPPRESGPPSMVSESLDSLCQKARQAVAQG